MTHVPNSFKEGLEQTIVSKASHVTEYAADAHPAFAPKIAGLKAEIASANAGHADASAQPAESAAAQACEKKIADTEAALKGLGEPAQRARAYASGTITDDTFDLTEGAVLALQRRLAALREGLPSLKPNGAARSARLESFARRESAATAALATARAQASIEIAKNQ